MQNVCLDRPIQFESLAFRPFAARRASFFSNFGARYLSLGEDPAKAFRMYFGFFV